MRAFLLEAGQAIGLALSFVATGLAAAELETSRAPYPAPGEDGPVRIESDERDGADASGDGGASGEPSRAPAPPVRVWLVDGFNVLHAGVLVGRDRAEWWSEARRAELLTIVERFDPGREDAEVWVVFDGPSAVEDCPREGSRVRVAFARSADDWLVKRVRTASEAVCVVTSDRSLADRARRRGAEVLAPRRFLARCGHVPARGA